MTIRRGRSVYVIVEGASCYQEPCDSRHSLLALYEVILLYMSVLWSVAIALRDSWQSLHKVLFVLSLTKIVCSSPSTRICAVSPVSIYFY